LNNLKQFGAACHNYESVWKRFPPGFNGIVTGGPSQHLYLLNYIEQEALSDKINLNAPANTQQTTVRIPTFICPSDGETEMNAKLRPTGGQATEARTRHNYRANNGTWPDARPGTAGANGIFFDYSPLAPPTYNGIAFRSLPPDIAMTILGVRVSDILDGTAFTGLFSERLVGDENQMTATPKRDSYPLPPPLPMRSDASADDIHNRCLALNPQTVPSTQNASTGGSTFNNGTLYLTWYNHTSPPNHKSCGDVTASPSPDGQGNPSALGGNGASMPPTSNHPGGVNFVLCDGSTRFIKDSISVPIWRNLGNRKDGNAIGQF
jgi:prepilin-type processing-associated H-X9-DG protein